MYTKTEPAYFSATQLSKCERLTKVSCGDLMYAVQSTFNRFEHEEKRSKLITYSISNTSSGRLGWIWLSVDVFYCTIRTRKNNFINSFFFLLMC